MGKNRGKGLASNRIYAEKGQTGQNIADTYHLLSKKTENQKINKSISDTINHKKKKKTTTKVYQKHTLTLKRSPRKRCCVEQKVHRKKSKTILLCKCLVSCCCVQGKNRKRAPKSAFSKQLKTQQHQNNINQQHFFLLQHIHSQILFLLLVRKWRQRRKGHLLLDVFLLY